MRAQQANVQESLLNKCNVQQNVGERQEFLQKQQEQLTTEMKAFSDALDDLGSTVQNDLGKLSKQSDAMQKTLLERMYKLLGSQEAAQTVTKPSKPSGGDTDSSLPSQPIS